MNRESINYYKEKILSGGGKRVFNVVGILLLRPNDQRKLMGNEKFEAWRIAIDEILKENYINHKIYEYYKTFDKSLHGFSNFERWLKWYN